MTFSISMQSLGKKFAPAVRSENWCFLYVTLGLHALGGHSSNKYCVTVCWSILMQFSSFFSQWIVLSDALYSSHFLLLVGTTIFAKLRSKIAKSPKIGVKVCAHHFV